MIELSHLTLILLCLSAAIVGGCFGLLLGCCCAMSSDTSRREECANEGDGDFVDPLWAP